MLLRVHDLGASEALPLVFHGSTYRQLQVGGVAPEATTLAVPARSAGQRGS